MKDGFDRAAHNRDQAADLRALAAKEHNAGKRDALLELAAQYENLCRRLIKQTPR